MILFELEIGSIDRQRHTIIILAEEKDKKKMHAQVGELRPAVCMYIIRSEGVLNITIQSQKLVHKMLKGIRIIIAESPLRIYIFLP